MATLYWDTNGATPGLGGVGTWDLSAANWTTDATGSSTTQAWNNGAGDDAVFSGTGAAVTIGSGANGNVLTSTDALGNVTSYTYDALNRRTLVTQADPDGAGPLASPVWETVYDVASQVTATIDPLGRTMTYEYDDLGRQTKVTSPDPDGAGSQTAAFTLTTYDAVGNVLTTEDALGHTTSYEYDNLYRLISSTNANLEETTFTYDLAGNRLTLTDPNNNTTTWEYDDLNRVVSETNELNKTRTYVYDVGGRLTSKVDRLGREVEYVYDNLNRVIEELWDSVSAYIWTYDAAGQLLTGGNAATREYVYTYDDLGRVTQIDTNEFGSSSVYDLNFTYDANSNVLTRSHAANTTDWTYDALNRASSVDSTGPSRVVRSTFNYNNAGQLTRQDNLDTTVGSPFWHINSTTTNVYDDAGRLENLTHRRPLLGGIFASYGYSWDAADRITAVDFLNGVYDNEDVDYNYDDAGQVTSADRAGSSTDEAYDYDDNGNRDSVTRDGTTTSWGVGTNNQLSSDGTNSYTYDDEGNLTSDGVSTYFWDHRNRLIEVRTGSTGVMYTYDVNNLRVGKILDLDGDWDYADPAELDSQTSYYFDGGRMIREVSANSSVENNYLFGPIAQLIAVEDVANDAIKLAYNDHLGTVRDVFDATTGTHVEHNVYDSFGRVVERQQFSGGVWNVVSSDSIVNLGYTGEYFDNSTGLQYNWNRWFNAETGRWISEDPIGFEGGDENLYRYVKNSSTTFFDPNGLDDARALKAVPRKDDGKLPGTGNPINPVLNASFVSWSWIIDWVIDPPTKQGGIIIQRVDLSIKAHKCAANGGGDISKDFEKDVAPWPLYEVFVIQKDGKSYVDHKNPDAPVLINRGNNIKPSDTIKAEIPSDNFAFGFNFKDEGKKLACTTGTITISGKATFYENQDTPAGFKATNLPPTGFLPTSKDDPKLTGGSSNSDRTVVYAWDFSGEQKDRKAWNESIVNDGKKIL